MGLMSGKVVAVTGGSSGNGRATARRFAEEGAAAIIVADRVRTPREGGVGTEELIRQVNEGTRTIFVECDLSTPGGIEAVIREGQAVGGIDVLVNNAGVYWRGAATEETAENFTRMIDINVRAPFFLSRAVA